MRGPKASHVSVVIALLIVGARHEPWLPATLESLAEAVDRLVVNDNSGDRGCKNRRALEASRLCQGGRLDIVEAPFVGFADARNRCLARIREIVPPTQAPPWILKVDADEVHDERLCLVTRTLLPHVRPGIGVVDGYFLQFMQSMQYYTGLDRRHDLFFRLTPDMRWERDVHEQLHGVRGRRVCLPYVYFHYGYASDARAIVEKWRQYRDLGDPTFREHDPVVTDEMFDNDIPRCLPLRRAHPPALGLLEATPPVIAQFNARVEQRLRRPGARVAADARRLNHRLALFQRALQSAAVLPPATWPTLLRLARA